MGTAKWRFNGGSEGGEGRLKVVDERFVAEKTVENGGGDENWWCCHGGFGIFFFFFFGKNGFAGEMDSRGHLQKWLLIYTIIKIGNFQHSYILVFN